MSYTVEKKLAAIARVESGSSMRSVAKDLGVDESMVRRWCKKQNKDKLRSSIGGNNIGPRQSRKLGCGRKAAIPELEKRLITWIEERNAIGLRVKDKYIFVKARALKDEMSTEISTSNSIDSEAKSKALAEFVMSPSWCNRFKQRHHLVARRHTTCRTLPEDFQAIARGFISDVQHMIISYSIAPQRIVNLDQVPRYFETVNSSTIIKRGVKEVVLKKASTSHKRFTFTPVITAAGDILALHLLFSHLKNVPKIEEGCIADVNLTGMWNDTILTKMIDFIVKKCQSPFRESTLILLDSNGTHINFVERKAESFARKNIFFLIIPPKMTGMLQPLDVAVNRGFQQSYNDNYNKHMTIAINSGDPAKRTKSGNIRMPSYFEISEWVIQ